MKSNSKENSRRDAEALSAETKPSVAEKFPRSRASTRENWKRVKLGEVCEIKNGKNQKSVEDDAGQYPIYGSGGIIGHSREYICNENSVIIGRKGTINRPIFVSTKFWNVDTAFGIETNQNTLNPKFFYYFCESFDFEKLSTTVTIPSLTKANISQIEIPLPPLEEQRRIAGTLDKVRELIDLRERELAKFDELVKCRFIEMFGDLANPACRWIQSKLVEACSNPDDIKCGPFGTQLSKDEYRHKGVALWEIPQINSQFKVAPTHYVDFDKAVELDAYSIVPGDIAMSRKGNVGRCAVFPCNYAPGIIHSDVLRIRVDSEKVMPVFMMFQLHYSGAVKRQIEQVSSGAIMAGINVTKLKDITVHLPPLSLQEEFARFVAAVDKSKFAVRQSLEKLKICYKSLMQEYFG